MKYIKDYNCWAGGIGYTNAIKIGDYILELIPIKHIYRLWRNKNGTYNNKFWLIVIKGMIHKKY